MTDWISSSLLAYLRTKGYSEMNYVISTDLFREEILPRIVHSRKLLVSRLHAVRAQVSK